MRVLLDECLPKRLARLLAGHDVLTVPQAGWAGVSNGALLARINGRFDAFITIDRNLPSQQSLVGLQFGLVVLRARSNRFESVAPLTPNILNALDILTPATVIVVDFP